MTPAPDEAVLLRGVSNLYDCLKAAFSAQGLLVPSLVFGNRELVCSW